MMFHFVEGKCKRSRPFFFSSIQGDQASFFSNIATNFPNVVKAKRGAGFPDEAHVAGNPDIKSMEVVVSIVLVTNEHPTPSWLSMVVLVVELFVAH